MVADDRDTQEPEYDYYDSADEEEEGGRGPVLAVVGLIVLAAFAGVVWVAYQQGMREGQRTTPPILRADTSPTKEVPAEPGGRVVPGQDRRVFDAVTGETHEEPEQLLPPPEEPMGAAEAETASAAPAEPSAPAPAPPSESASPAPTEPAVAPAPKPAPSEAEAPAPAETTVATTEAPAAASTAAGNWLVQIGAYRSREEAEQGWASAQSKYPGVLGDYGSDIMEVDLGARGVYQRLRFGPFDTREAAVDACETLKAQRQDCLVVKR